MLLLLFLFLYDERGVKVNKENESSDWFVKIATRIIDFRGSWRGVVSELSIWIWGLEMQEPWAVG